MKSRIAVLIALSTVLVLSSIGCATKKYARNRINERVTPLEQRTGELEETSRRNSQDIGRLGTDVNEVRGRADRAQSQADTALSRATEATTRARRRAVCNRPANEYRQVRASKHGNRQLQIQQLCAYARSQRIARSGSQ